MEVLCVTWLLPVGVGERKICENSLDDNRGVLGIMRRLCKCFVLTCVWCSCVILFSVWGVSRTGGVACLPHF